MKRIFVFVSVLGMSALAGCDTQTNAPKATAEKAVEVEREEMMATLINLRGHLCAKVIFVGPEVDSGERQVNCNEYRDPTKAKTKNNMAVYMVDLQNGAVRLIGRG